MERTLCLLALLLALPASALRGQDAAAWTPVDDEDGIRVSRRDIPEQAFPWFRGEATLPAPIERIVAVLKQVDRHTEWMHRCSASELIEQVSEEQAIIYNKTDLPWPVWDRDVILDTRFSTSADGQTVTLTFQEYQPRLRPLSPRVVRMPRLRGFYAMQRLSAQETRVIYQVEADVGGSVPQWIAQRVARDMPYETLYRLRERVHATKAQ